MTWWPSKRLRSKAMAPAHLLDLTRLVSRLGREALTGVDRVELAWAERLLEGEAREGIPLFALVRTAWGFGLLDGRGVAKVLAVAGGAPVGRADLLGRISRRKDPLRARAEALVRRESVTRCTVPGLARMLRRLPEGTAYFNMGHANLTPRVMAAQRGPRVVLIHDTIPLDHPEFTRPGIPEVFARKLKAAMQADLIVHTAQATRSLTEAQMARLGPLPAGVVAPLGVGLPAPCPFTLPGLDPNRPFFVTVGTIEPRKNHALLLDVWEALAARHAPEAMPQLVIAGSRGWLNRDVFARLDARPPHVIEAPGLSDSALAGLLQASHGLLFPTLAEGFGLPPLEAAGLGVPLIVNDLPVLRETLGELAVYLSAADVYSWMETIERAAGGGHGWGEGVRGMAVRQGGPALPDWASHFNIVLNFLRQTGPQDRTR